MPAVGGYVELGSHVVVYALAAMALNFLLGYTGVLSFGHAAYFGLGAYGTAMTIKYVYPSTPLGMLVGIIVGTVAAAIIGPLIVRLRGVYFAMCTIAFGQVFYFIAFQWRSVTGGDDGVSAWTPHAAGFRLRQHRHPQQSARRSITSCWRYSPSARRRWRSCCARRSAARCWRSARTSGAPASSAFRSTGTSGCPG